jgi:DNA-binding response OmpR family regulator
MTGQTEQTGSAQTRLLLVEDDDSVARFLKQATLEAGYSVEVVGDGLEGLRRAISEPFDLVLLDVMLPSLDGLEVCRRLRAAQPRTAILIITARDTLEDKLAGLDGGADDYLVKPFQLAELLARVRALLRRSSSAAGPLQVADLILDPLSREARRGDKTIGLSSTEYALLEYLMRHPGQVLTRAMILEHVWQYDFGGNDNVLDVYISYLRRKIDRGHPRPLIHTVRGIGFRAGDHAQA